MTRGDVPVVCALCGEPMTYNDSDRRGWRRMRGWHRRGRAGGSDIALRTFEDEFAHNECVEREQKHVAAGQLGFDQ